MPRRKFKSKEEPVLEFLERKFQGDPWIHNQAVVNSSSRKRPDIRVELPDLAVVVEIDEDQHKRYTHQEEMKRMREIKRDLRKNVIFFRFNPDNYKIGNDRFSCCFDGVSGCYHLNPEMNEDWESRLMELEEKIRTEVALYRSQNQRYDRRCNPKYRTICYDE